MTGETERSPEYVLFMISLVATMAVGVYIVSGQLPYVAGVTAGSAYYWARTAPDLDINLTERLVIRD